MALIEKTSNLTPPSSACSLKMTNKNGVSPVNRMFMGRSVFITGASGFIGRVLLEKLLRSYQGIKRIYILLRPKRNVPPHERLQGQLLNAQIFDRIRQMKNGQELLDKIVVVSGDIGQPNLGISGIDMQLMLEDKTLGIVFHSAATVKFDEPLKTAIKFNLIAAQSVISFCRRLPNLIALCHVSTAYANSDITGDQLIEEKLYPMRESAERIIKLEALLDEDMLQMIKPILIGNRPNTYTYTKSLAEQLIAHEASDLPVAIVRPSIVAAAWKDPLPGWVDNLNGPTGLILAVGKGLLRSMHVKKDAKADIIPVDVVVNTMIASSYFVAKTSNKLLGSEDANQNNKISSNDSVNVANQSDSAGKPPIFHCTSGNINPITWGWMEEGVFPIIKRYPSKQVFRYPFGSFKSNRYQDFITRLFVHYLPALILDLVCLVLRDKRRLLSIYYKLHGAVGALEAFATQNFNFSSDNMSLLMACLKDENDKRELFLDIRSLNWHDYFGDYVLGARRYILKESDDTLEEARESFKRAFYIEVGLRVSMLVVTISCCLHMVA